MGYHDLDNTVQHPPHTSLGKRLANASENVADVLVRIAGITLILVGLWVGVLVTFEAWSLYQQPRRIEPMVEYVDSVAGNTAVPTSLSSLSGEEQEGPPSAQAVQAGASMDDRLSFLVAWVLTLMLLPVSGLLAFKAVEVGGSLALHKRPRHPSG